MSSQYTLAQITDCHLFADPSKAGYSGINPYQSLEKVLLEVRKQRPDCVLVTGDVSGDYSEQSYAHFIQLWQQSGITAPLFSVAGNHDNIGAWQDCFGCKHEYLSAALGFGHWHLHMLPSEFEGAKGRLKRDATQHMCDNIESNRDAHHIVAMHHPLTLSDVWMDKHRLVNPEVFTGYLPMANLRAVIHGHVHTERKVMLHKTPIYACPSTCWQWGNSVEFSVSEQMPGFRTLKLNEDGHFSTMTHYVNT